MPLVCGTRPYPGDGDGPRARLGPSPFFFGEAAGWPDSFSLMVGSDSARTRSARTLSVSLSDTAALASPVTFSRILSPTANHVTQLRHCP
jgi:hypothetical protein